MMMNSGELYIANAIKAARDVQDFLWGHHNARWGIDEWKLMFKKRLHKIDDIDPKNPHAVVELRKRLLQNAALSIALLQRIDDGDMEEETLGLVSNLEQYKAER